MCHLLLCAPRFLRAWAPPRPGVGGVWLERTPDPALRSLRGTVPV